MTRPALRLIVILVVLSAWRVLAAAHLNMELFADEAQYWTWSLTPDWGYYSKPPMVAWAIWLGTHLFGDGELGVRAASVLAYPVTAWLLFLFVRRLFHAEANRDTLAFWTGLLYATLPFVSVGAWLITTDAFLILFWSLSLYLLTYALESGRWRDWLLLGGAIGLGMMSKYSMVFFGLGLAAYLAITPARRRLFLDPRPYAAALVALLVTLPNILWNAGHHFVSFSHTADISHLDRALFHPDALLAFFVGQFAVFGPLTFGALLILAARPRTWLGDDRLRLLAAFALAPLAAFLGLALLARAFANWAAFAYASATALVAVTWLMGNGRRWLRASVVLHLVVALGLYHAHDIAAALDLKLTRGTDPYARVTGYRALGEATAQRLRALPGVRLLNDDRKLFALLRYYARPYSDDARFLNPSGVLDNHYALTADLRAAPDGRFLLVSASDLGERLPGWFARVEPQAPIVVQPYPNRTVSYRVWLVQDYRGR
ncbi:glycosyltransferase family 39 protein [Parasulfuritortus cantonensis]|uniref:Glycosyltransferase family 39 protein n=1 Tax=Parasulfuritortus cantonensis TaxID=2528202 RepID=A0A4R1BM82_9PROT|nr:glycosyltransferase family 39 protein [Parasulfuritortus cantonensis]TCJ18505.1 glycosyltransferase family 39 protein [Parasulfuritortus cantonensis]